MFNNRVFDGLLLLAFLCAMVDRIFNHQAMSLLEAPTDCGSSNFDALSPTLRMLEKFEKPRAQKLEKSV